MKLVHRCKATVGYERGSKAPEVGDIIDVPMRVCAVSRDKLMLETHNPPPRPPAPPAPPPKLSKAERKARLGNTSSPPTTKKKTKASKAASAKATTP